MPPEWVIVGLGNPGPEYARTRHNVGFDTIDALAKRYGIRLEVRKHKAVYGFGQLEGVPVVLAKPLTFMNLSGQAVAPLAREFSIAPAHVLVISDDLDMDLARTRLKPKGGAGGHNGHKSIIHALGSTDYPRLKIGIGRSEDETIDHVLTQFPPDERTAIDEAIERSVKGIELLVTEGIDAAMTAVNTG